MAEGTETNSNGNKAEEPTELEQKIIHQVEYYFGDINLGKDKFLQEQIKEDDGWVTLQTMIKFQRLAKLSDDTGVIAAALKKSASGLIEVDDENTKIRRSPDKPLPEFTKERMNDLKTRSVYAKNIPIDSTLDAIETFFMKYGKVEHIQMRKDEVKNFKGSVFVLFVDKESAEKFVKAENMKFPGSEEELVKMSKDDYWKKKSEERKKSKEDELRQREEAKTRREEEEEEDFKKKLTQGAILVLEGMPKDVRRDEVKELFKKYGPCAWVDMDEDACEARIRFEEENSASAAMEKAKEAGEGVIKVNDTEVKARVLEGDEEKEHWKKMFQDMRAKKSRDRSRRGGFRGRGRHGGGPPKKKQRTE